MALNPTLLLVLIVVTSLPLSPLAIPLVSVLSIGFSVLSITAVTTARAVSTRFTIKVVIMTH